MTIAETRKKLIEEINCSNNKNLLEEMYNFLSEDNATNNLYKLSKNQKLSIEKGREQIKNGASYTNEDVNSEIEKWLNDK